MRSHFLSTITLLALGLASATAVKVQLGDTLTRVAVRSGTTPEALQRANPTVNPKTLRVGTVLQLPALASRTWTVRSGDTLSRIGQQHGITLNALLRANPGLNPQQPLRIGQRLALPGTAQTYASMVIRAASLRPGSALPVQGRITTAYNSMHPGLDVAAPAGSPIRAALPGTVIESHFDARTGWGWTIVIDHGAGRTTRYSHNSVNLVRVGARVSAGQVIARVGSTGKSTGAHLDYRMYVRGQAINAFALQ